MEFKFLKKNKQFSFPTLAEFLEQKVIFYQEMIEKATQDNDFMVVLISQKDFINRLSEFIAKDSKRAEENYGFKDKDFINSWSEFMAKNSKIAEEYYRRKDSNLEDIQKIFSQIEILNQQSDKIISQNRQYSYLIIAIRDLVDACTKQYTYIEDLKKFGFEDEYEMYVFNRDDVHVLLQFAREKNIEIPKTIITIIQETDKKAIDLARKEKPKYKANHSIIYPNSHWWYHLHELDKLSKKDLETI